MNTPTDDTGYNYAGGGTAWVRLGYLRLVLALLVVAQHALLFQPGWPSILVIPDHFGGKSAVVCFLVVSGFSIAASLERRRADFFWRRALRVYPVYVLALAATAVLERLCDGLYVAPHLRFEGEGWVTLIGNAFFLQTFLVKPVSFDRPVWSLAVEVSYYALAPLLVSFRPGWVLLLMTCSALSFLLPKHIDLGIAYHVFSKFNALNYLWPWLLGVVLWQQRARLEFKKGKILLVLIALAAGLIQIAPATRDSYGAITLIITTACIWPWKHRRFGSIVTRAGAIAGDMSYAVYLLNLPLLIALGRIGYADNLPVVMLAVLGCSYLVIIVWEPGARWLMERLRTNVRLDASVS